MTDKKWKKGLSPGPFRDPSPLSPPRPRTRADSPVLFPVVRPVDRGRDSFNRGAFDGSPLHVEVCPTVDMNVEAYPTAGIRDPRSHTVSTDPTKRTFAKTTGTTLPVHLIQVVRRRVEGGVPSFRSRPLLSEGLSVRADVGRVLHRHGTAPPKRRPGSTERSLESKTFCSPRVPQDLLFSTDHTYPYRRTPGCPYRGPSVTLFHSGRVSPVGSVGPDGGPHGTQSPVVRRRRALGLDPGAKNS